MARIGRRIPNTSPILGPPGRPPAQPAITITIDPAEFSFSAEPETIDAGGATATLTPATFAFSSQPETTTVGGATATLTPATVAFGARPETIAPGGTAQAISPASFTFSAVAETITTARSVSITPASFTFRRLLRRFAATATSFNSSNPGQIVQVVQTDSGGRGRYVLVSCVVEHTNAALTATADLGGLTLTSVPTSPKQEETSEGAFLSAFMWYGLEADLAAHGVAGGRNLTVTTNANLTGAGMVAGYVMYEYAAQIAPPVVAGDHTPTDSTTKSLGITTLHDNATVVDVVGGSAGGTATPDAGQTLLINPTGGTSGFVLGMSERTVATPGSATMGWTLSASQGRWVQIAATVLPEAGVKLASAASTTLSPASFEFSAQAETVAVTTSMPISPASFAFSARPYTTTVGGASITLSPASLSFEAVPLFIGSGHIVPIDAATMSFSSVALTTTVAGRTVTLTPASVAFSAQPVVASSVLAVTLTPAVVTFSAEPLEAIIGAPAYAIAPARFELDAVPLTLGQGVTVPANPASFRFDSIPVGVHVVPPPQPRGCLDITVTTTASLDITVEDCDA